MYWLTSQVELLHRQEPGTKFGLRTLAQTTQVRACFSLTKEQTGHDPFGLEDCGAVDLVTSSLKIVGAPLSLPPQFSKGSLALGRLGGCVFWMEPFNASGGLEDAARVDGDKTSEVSILLKDHSWWEGCWERLGMFRSSCSSFFASLSSLSSSSQTLT
jgi:hypothetical protein